MQPADLPESLRRAAELMRDYPAPWCVAGGWALDLFLGRITREHADLELALFRDDQALLRGYLREWTFEKIVDGRRVAWTADERLDLPVHEIHARSRNVSNLAIEILFNERTSDQWVFRRDARVTRPIVHAILRRAMGCPILSPEIVLLYKAKAPRPKDEADFRAAREALGSEQRLWFSRALRTVHPSHPWLDLL